MLIVTRSPEGPTVQSKIKEIRVAYTLQDGLGKTVHILWIKNICFFNKSCLEQMLFNVK